MLLCLHGPIELKIILGHPRHIWNGLEWFSGWALTKVLLTESDHHIIEYMLYHISHIALWVWTQGLKYWILGSDQEAIIYRWGVQTQTMRNQILVLYPEVNIYWLWVWTQKLKYWVLGSNLKISFYQMWFWTQQGNMPCKLSKIFLDIKFDSANYSCFHPC